MYVRERNFGRPFTIWQIRTSSNKGSLKGPIRRAGVLNQRWGTSLNTNTGSIGAPRDVYLRRFSPWKSSIQPSCSSYKDLKETWSSIRGGLGLCSIFQRSNKHFMIYWTSLLFILRRQLEYELCLLILTLKTKLTTLSTVLSRARVPRGLWTSIFLSPRFKPEHVL